MQFTGVLDQHDAVATGGDLRQQGVHQGCLACRGAPDDKDVPALADSLTQDVSLRGGHDCGRGIVSQ